MAHGNATPDPHTLFWSRRCRFSVDELTTTWDQVLANSSVYSTISVDLVSHRRSTLRLEHDPSEYWITYATTTEDGMKRKNVRRLVQRWLPNMETSSSPSEGLTSYFPSSTATAPLSRTITAASAPFVQPLRHKTPMPPYPYT